jgi:branched-chain amino acid transport system permease protein
MGNLIHSRFGRGLQTIATNEMLARVMGIPVQDYKLKVFVLAAMVSSLAGSLYAHYVTFISPYPFGFKFSIDMVLMAVVGGLSSLWGPFLGAAFFVLASEILRFTVPIILPGSGGELESIFFGVVLVLLIIFRPAGLGRSLEELILRLTRPPVTPPSVGEKGGTGHASTS